MNIAAPITAWQADGPAVAVREKAAPLRERVLSHDELIELSLKPSLWYVVFVSLRLVLASAIVAAAALVPAAGHWTPIAGAVIGLALLTAVGRLAVGMLQWASRLFLLTNRRVLKFKGVLQVHCTECALRRVASAELTQSWYQRTLRLGTITIESAEAGALPVVWKHVHRPRDVHAAVLRAIARAQS